MKILQNLRNKAVATIQGIGNFIDRDKSMGGVQLAQGGLGNRIQQGVQNWVDKPSNQMVNQGVQSWQDKPANSMVNSFLAPSPDGVRTRDIIREIPGAAVETAKDFFIRPTARAAASTGLSLRELLGGSGQTTPEELAQGMPNQGMRDLLFAGDLPSSIQNQTREAAPKIEDFLAGAGVNQDFAQSAASPLAFLGVAGITALDAIPSDPTDLVKAGGRGIQKTLKPKVVSNLIDDVTPPVTTNYFKKKGSTQPDFIAGGDGVTKVKEVGPRKLTDMLNPQTERVITDAPLKLGAGTIPEKPIGLPEGTNLSKDPITTDVGNKFTRTIRNMFLDTKDNLKKTFGEVYDTTVSPIIKNHERRLSESVDWGNKYYKSLEDTVRSVGIKPGSEEDKLIRLFGEKGGDKKVVSKVGQERASQLRSVYADLRRQYDEIFDFINLKRSEAGLNQIPKKDDFLSAVGSGSKKSFSDFNVEGGVYSPNEVSSAIFKKQGDNASTGAIESMTKYLDYAKRAGFSDLTGKELETLRTTLSNNKSVPREALEQLEKIETSILGTRSTSPLIKTAEKLLGKIRGAKVVGKASTLVSQTFNLPQGIAKTGPLNFVKGQFSGDASKAIGNSKFLKAVTDRVPKSLRTGNLYDKAVGAGGDLLMDAQNMTSKALWKGFYNKARQMGLKGQQAVDWADENLPKIVGDRRLGMSPESYNTFLGKMFGAFTIEPTAASTQLFKDIGQKNVSAILGTLVAWHVSNNLNEKYGTGYRPFFDPYEAVKDSLEYYTGSDKKKESKIKAVTRLLNEGLQLAPQVNNYFNTAYSVGESDGVLPDSVDVMGGDRTWMNVTGLYNPLQNQGRVVTGNRAVDLPLNVASNLLPFFEQAARTTQAANTQARGYSETKTGSPMYKAPDNPLEAGRSLLFGQSSTQNARDFFDNDFRGWMTKAQQATIDKIPTKEGKLDFLQKTQDRNENLNRVKNKTETIKEANKKGLTVKQSDSLEDILSKPTNSAEKKENTTMLNEMLDSGISPSTNDLSIGLFDGKKATSTNLKEKADTYSKLHSSMQNEYYTDEQKEAILKASGATKDDYDYYQTATLPWQARIQEITPTLGDLSERGNFEDLIKLKKTVAGKAIIQEDMVNYLYDMGEITKEQKELVNAIKYDEAKGQFYIKRGSKFHPEGTGAKPKTLTYTQALNIFKVDVKGLSKSQPFDLSRLTSRNSNLLQNILNKR